MFQNLLEIQEDLRDMPDENCDFKKLKQGHFVQMGCGHRGIPARTEEKRVSRLLRKSGFIPMLEQMNKPVSTTQAAAPAPAKIPSPLVEEAIQTQVLLPNGIPPQTPLQEEPTGAARLTVQK